MQLVLLSPKKRIIFARILFALLLINSPLTQASDKSGNLIDWQEWSSESFAKAKKENKLVIMDLEAVWCHWCHVMDAKTYRNPDIAKLINKHFVAIRVDQDAHPDISNRYEDYGWPATVIFDADGKEIIKRLLILSQNILKMARVVFRPERLSQTTSF